MAGFQIYGAGRAGDGTNTNIGILSQALKDMGAWTFNWRDEVYSNIQTRDSGFGLRASVKPIFGPDDWFEILEAFDEGALIDIAGEGRIPPIHKLSDGGVLIYDSSERLEAVNSGHEIKLEKVAEILEAKRVRLFGAPMGRIAKDELNIYNARGTIAQGIIAELVGITDEAILGRFAKSYGEGSATYTANEKALAIGREYAKNEGWETPELKAIKFTAVPNDNRQIILGDYAVAAGAIAAGCRVYAGYPITPASEVLEYMAEKIHLFGGAMIQADSEMAAAHHVIGSSVAGARAMTATSGPGFSLMQEAISAGGITETPMVIVVCTRGGPGTGLPTRQGQEELNETIFGGHGDFARIVLAASEPEQCFYIMEHVFNLAERYQCPTFLIIDQMLAQSSYTVPALDPTNFVIDRGKLIETAEDVAKFTNGNGYKRYLVTEDGISPRAVAGVPGITNYYTNTNEHTEDGYITEEETVRQVMMDKRFTNRMPMIEADPQLPDAGAFGSPDAKIGFISYGGTFGPIIEAMERMEAAGTPSKFLDLRTLWPFPDKQIAEFVESCDVVYVPEYSAGAQLRGLIQRQSTGPSKKLKSLLRYDGRNMTPGWVLDKMKEA